MSSCKRLIVPPFFLILNFRFFSFYCNPDCFVHTRKHSPNVKSLVFVQTCNINVRLSVEHHNVLFLLQQVQHGEYGMNHQHVLPSRLHDCALCKHMQSNRVKCQMKQSWWHVVVNLPVNLHFIEIATSNGEIITKHKQSKHSWIIPSRTQAFVVWATNACSASTKYKIAVQSATQSFNPHSVRPSGKIMLIDSACLFKVATPAFFVKMSENCVVLVLDLTQNDLLLHHWFLYHSMPTFTWRSLPFPFRLAIPIAAGGSTCTCPTDGFLQSVASWVKPMYKFCFCRRKSPSQHARSFLETELQDHPVSFHTSTQSCQLLPCFHCWALPSPCTVLSPQTVCPAGPDAMQFARAASCLFAVILSPSNNWDASCSRSSFGSLPGVLTMFASFKLSVLTKKNVFGSPNMPNRVRMHGVVRSGLHLLLFLLAGGRLPTS